MANLQLCSKPPPVLKRQHLKAAKSSEEKEHWTWTASDPFLSVRPVSFLCSPLAHLSETVTWDTHFPLSQCPCVYPDGKVSGGKAGDARAQQQEPRASLSLRLLCLVWSVPVLEAAPGSSPVCRRLCQDVSSSVAWCFCLRPRAWLPASPSLHVPLASKAHPTPLLQQKQPLVFPPRFAPSS